MFVVSWLTQEELELMWLVLVGDEEDKVDAEFDNAGLEISAIKSNHLFTALLKKQLLVGIEYCAWFTNMAEVSL